MSKKASEIKKMSIVEELDKAAFHGHDVTKETLRKHLHNDLTGVYLVMADVLRSKECIDALTDIFYKRYQDLVKQREANVTTDNHPYAD